VFAAVGVMFGGAIWREGVEAASESLATAPPTLMETGLYASPGVIDPRNRPFSPQYPLWTDGANKRRWIRFPEGSKVDASDVHEWTFPTGTKVWKEFSFGGRKVETRLLWKTGADAWVFASYVWNAEGTEATLAPAEGLMRVAEVAPNKYHNIPAVDQCRACHVSNRTELLGFNALQLSTDRDPNALHAEGLEPGMITVKTLVEEDLMTPVRAELVARPPRIAARTPDERALLGYLAGNCGACHNRQSDLAPLGLHWKHSDMTMRGADALLSLLAHRTKWQVPDVPDGESVVIDPAQPEQSALLSRMRSRSPASQMPPMGTAVQDRDAVALVTRWLERQQPSAASREGAR
jgi:cytochrome c553